MAVELCVDDGLIILFLPDGQWCDVDDDDGGDIVMFSLSSSLSLLWWWLKCDGVSIGAFVDFFRLRLRRLIVCSFVVLVLTFSFSLSLLWLLLFSSSQVGGGFNGAPSQIIPSWRYFSNSSCSVHTCSFSSVNWYVRDIDLPQTTSAVPSCPSRGILSYFAWWNSSFIIWGDRCGQIWSSNVDSLLKMISS